MLFENEDQVIRQDPPADMDGDDTTDKPDMGGTGMDDKQAADGATEGTDADESAV